MRILNGILVFSFTALPEPRSYVNWTNWITCSPYSHESMHMCVQISIKRPISFNFEWIPRELWCFEWNYIWCLFIQHNLARAHFIVQSNIFTHITYPSSQKNLNGRNAGHAQLPVFPPCWGRSSSRWCSWCLLSEGFFCFSTFSHYTSRVSK